MVVSKLFSDWESSGSPSDSQAENNVKGKKLFDSPKTVFQFPTSGDRLAVRHCLLSAPPTSTEPIRTNASAQNTRIWDCSQGAGDLCKRSMGDKDRVALISALAVLETELHDYQYNMGLLLLERKTWVSDCDKVRIATEETEENLTRERELHSRELAEAACREAMLLRALDAEKQCTTDLQRAMREVRLEAMDIKLSARKELTQAQSALLEVEQKERSAKASLLAAEALSAEVQRRSAQTETKLHEIESRELALRMEKQALALKLEAHASKMVLEEQSLEEWQRKLQEGQDRMLQGEKMMNKRELLLSDKDERLLKAEKEMLDRRRILDAEQAAIRRSRQELEVKLAAEEERQQALVERELSLARKEQEMLVRQDEQSSKERDTQKYEAEVSKLKQLVVSKKDQLQALQSTANKKKREIAKQTRNIDLLKLKLEEEKACLEDKRRRYEATALELQELHQCLEVEKESLAKEKQALEESIAELERRSKNVAAREQEVVVREALLKEKEKQAELVTSKTLKEEQTVNRKQKILAAERRNVEDEIKVARNDIQCMITEIDNRKQKLQRLRQKLQQAEQIHHYLQSDIDDLKVQRQKASENVEGLRAERARCARERNMLEVKAAKIQLEAEAYQEDRKSMSTWLQSEEERIKREKEESLDQFHKDAQALLKDKEHFDQEIASQRSELISELQKKKQELETNLLSRQKELEWRLDKEREGIRLYYLEKESNLLKEVKQEKEQIRASRESVMQAMKAIKMERALLDKERQKVDTLQTLSESKSHAAAHVTASAHQGKHKEQVLAAGSSVKVHGSEEKKDSVYIGECSIASEGAGNRRTTAPEKSYFHSQQLENVTAHEDSLPTVQLRSGKGGPTHEKTANRNDGKRTTIIDILPQTEATKGDRDDQALHLSDCADPDQVENPHSNITENETMDSNSHHCTNRKRRRSLVVQLS